MNQTLKFLIAIALIYLFIILFANADPFVTIEKYNAYGPGIHMDQYGRPAGVQPYVDQGRMDNGRYGVCCNNRGMDSGYGYSAQARPGGTGTPVYSIPSYPTMRQ